MLYILGFHRSDEKWLRHTLNYTDEALAGHLAAAVETQQLLAEIAEQTRNSPEPALRIAHCIRDLAYGDESRAEDLKVMVHSAAPEYHQIFVDCYWLPTEDERLREEENANDNNESGTIMEKGPD